MTSLPSGQSTDHRPRCRPSCRRYSAGTPTSQRVVAALNERRLVTLSGPGGVGKTRLAIAVAEQEAPHRPAGVIFADLAAVGDGASVPGAMAAGMGILSDVTTPPLSMLASGIAEKPVLLVVDNCEHVISSAAEAIGELLARCRHLQVLATSRELLSIDGEMPIAVAPRDRSRSGGDPSVPGPRARRLPLVRCGGPRGRHRRDLRATRWSAACDRAGRCPDRVLSVVEIASRLDDRLALLTGGRRRAARRQQTLRATIAWSFDLLDPVESDVALSCSTFQGGWSLAAAVAVTDLDEAVVLEALDSLVAKSLVTAEPGRYGTRYRMLETIREFAIDELAAQGRAESIRRRHAVFFAGDGEWPRPTMVSLDDLVRRRIDGDNFFAALSWATETQDRCLTANLLCTWAGYAAFDRSNPDVPAALDACLDDDTLAPLSRARLQGAAAAIDSQTRHMSRHVGLLAAANPVLAAHADPQYPFSLAGGQVTNMLVAPDEAARVLDEALELAEAAGEPQLIGTILAMKGWAASFARRYDDAARLLTRACSETTGWTVFTAQATTEAALCESLAGRSEHAMAALAACPDFAGTCSYVEIVSEFDRVFTEMIVGDVDRGTDRLADLTSQYLDTRIPLLHDGLRVGFALRAHALGDEERAHQLVGPTITPEHGRCGRAPAMSTGFSPPGLLPERSAVRVGGPTRGVARGRVRASPARPVAGSHTRRHRRVHETIRGRRDRDDSTRVGTAGAVEPRIGRFPPDELPDAPPPTRPRRARRAGRRAGRRSIRCRPTT